MSGLGRLAFLGLDGTPYTLLARLAGMGLMPNLAGFLKRGTFVPMETTLPEVSSVAWSTFMTGVNPGQHGIFGFTDLKPGSYSLYFPNFGNLRHETLWDAVGRAGGRSVVINVPSTYPVRPLTGVITAGFVALDLKKATYPDPAYQYLQGIGYRMDVDTAKARESTDFLVEDLKQTFLKRREAMLHFLEHEPWDLFIGVVTETDRLHHFLWSSYADLEDPLHGFFLDFYRDVDSFIGEFADTLKRKHPDAPLMMMSDHGFTASMHEVYVNRWLRDNGYQDLLRDPAQSWEDIGPGTRAFAMDPSRVYINLKGKYPRGTVEAGDEYEALCSELIERFSAIEHEGRKVLKAVYRKADVYSGPYTGQAPDLVLLPNYGFDLKGAISRDVVFAKSALSGMHTQDDAFLYLSRNMDEDGVMDIERAGRAVLDLMGCGGIREDKSA